MASQCVGNDVQTFLDLAQGQVCQSFKAEDWVDKAFVEGREMGFYPFTFDERLGV